MALSIKDKPPPSAPAILPVLVGTEQFWVLSDGWNNLHVATAHAELVAFMQRGTGDLRLGGMPENTYDFGLNGAGQALIQALAPCAMTALS